MVNKNDLIRSCYENRGSPLGQTMVSLLESLLDEARRKNDDAKIVSVYRNQGEIKGLKTLLNYFIKKLPDRPEKT